MPLCIHRGDLLTAQWGTVNGPRYETVERPTCLHGRSKQGDATLRSLLKITLHCRPREGTLPEVWKHTFSVCPPDGTLRVRNLLKCVYITLQTRSIQYTGSWGGGGGGDPSVWSTSSQRENTLPCCNLMLQCFNFCSLTTYTRARRLPMWEHRYL